MNDKIFDQGLGNRRLQSEIMAKKREREEGRKWENKDGDDEKMGRNQSGSFPLEQKEE